MGKAGLVLSVLGLTGLIAFALITENGSTVVTAGKEVNSLYNFSTTAFLPPTTTAVVTFYQSGVGLDYANFVLNVDGVDYKVADLPKSFTWTVGSTHTFEFYDPLNVGADKRYVWIKTEGLSADIAGDITVPSGGGVVNGTYKTQYLVIVTASPNEAQGGTFKVDFTSGTSIFHGKTGITPYDIWANEGTWVNVTNPQLIIDSYEFSHYNPSSNVYIDGPKTITLVYKKPEPPVGGIIMSPEENPAATANNTAITILAIILIIAVTVAARKTHK